MIKNSITTAIRSVIDNKGYSLINIIGLSLGIASVIAILLWVEDEMKFDSFNENANEMYRVISEESHTAGYFNSATTMPPLADALKENIPEIVIAANFEMDWQVVVKVGDKYLNEDRLATVNAGFFKMFSFPFLKGNAKSFESEKYVVILSESTAKSYFGNIEPIGEYIEIDKTIVKVVGVIKDIDYNSHISFDMAIPEEFSMELFGREKGQWDNQCLYTYIQLEKDVNIELLESKIYSFIPDQIDSESKYKLFIQPLADIHFQKNMADEDYTNLGDIRYVSIFSFISLFILLLACINFINLSTAVSDNKMKDIGVRKILGANKLSLVKDSILKTLFTATLASVIALLILYLLLPNINSLTGKNISLDLLRPMHVTVLILINILTGVFAGIYPAFYLSSVAPISIIRKNTSMRTQNLLRNGLVVFQFSLSIVLIIATIISSKQLKHIQNINLGFNQEQIFYLPLNTETKSKYEVLKSELLQLPYIDKISGKGYYSSTILYTTEVYCHVNDIGRMVFSEHAIDEDFFPILNINIVEGRNFSNELDNNESRRIIINRTAQERMEVGTAIGEKLTLYEKEFEIIGVIDDVHFRSVNEKIQPELYYFSKTPEYVFIKYDSGSESIENILAGVEKTVALVYPTAPFEFEFLDSTYAKLYKNDKRVGAIFRILAIIAIFLSCLGLFGLSSFNFEKRIKEIGIRKVNGAKIFDIIKMLNRAFVKWIAIAFFIASPIAYYAMNKWLQSFAYKTALNWWIFPLAGCVALAIALTTVSWQTFRAARRNPVEALRYE